MSVIKNYYGVNEYEANVFITFIQAVLYFFAMIVFFTFDFVIRTYQITPVCTGECDAAPAVLRLGVEYKTMFDVLTSSTFRGMQTIISIAFLVYATYGFINVVLTSIFPRIGKSVYIKVCKLVEIALAVLCLFVMTSSFANMFELNYEYDGFDIYPNSQLYSMIFIIGLIVSLISYYNVKKKTIYD